VTRAWQNLVGVLGRNPSMDLELGRPLVEDAGRGSSQSAGWLGPEA
jgi:hypothetical protein